MFVYERMIKNPITISVSAVAKQAMDLMEKNKLQSLPVMDKGKLVGIITKEDIMGQFLCDNKGCRYKENTPIEDIMTKRVFTVAENDYLEKAVSLIKERRISTLPVVSKNDELVGIITRTDIYNALLDTLGVDNRGTRIYSVIPNFIGQIAKVTSIINSNAISLEAISLFDINKENAKGLVLKVKEKNVDKLIKDLKDSGIDVRDVGYDLK
ncbi:MAG: CBS domain-containing protein [Firmicutes bacterium]|nr:CBS domain-containing protein [Bacillota bacterium]